MTKNIVCTACPRGCHLSVVIDDKIKVEGNKCPKGDVYGKQEVTCPMRMLTTTVATENKEHPRLSVKTKNVVPLKNFSQYMREIRTIKFLNSCKPGDIIVKDFCGTGIELVATSSI